MRARYSIAIYLLASSRHLSNVDVANNEFSAKHSNYFYFVGKVNNFQPKNLQRVVRCVEKSIE